MADINGISSSSSLKEENPVVIGVKRKAPQMALDTFWLEINERPLKRTLLDLESLSSSISSPVNAFNCWVSKAAIKNNSVFLELKMEDGKMESAISNDASASQMPPEAPTSNDTKNKEEGTEVAVNNIEDNDESCNDEWDDDFEYNDVGAEDMQQHSESDESSDDDRVDDIQQFDESDDDDRDEDIQQNDETDALDRSIRDELQDPIYRPLGEEDSVIYIPKVPQRLQYRDSNDRKTISIGPYDIRKPFTPLIISIGPYHYSSDPAFKPMATHKWHHLQAILSRNAQVSLKDYIREMKGLEMRARKCYSGYFYRPNGDFVKSMLLDGCFIVEYLLIKYAGNRSNRLSGMMEDLVFHDLLLLENQLPFFVLQRIFDLLATETAERREGIPSSFSELVINLFNQRFSTMKTGLPIEPIHHLLHFFHWFLVSMPIPLEPVSPLPTPPGRFKLKCLKHLVGFHSLFLSSKQKHPKPAANMATKKEAVYMIPNAVELQEAGIKFKKREVEGGSMLDVKFNDGVLEIPPLIVDGFMLNHFRNLIVFEQFYPCTEAKLTTYIMFLSNIVRTGEDVALLHKNGIIQHIFRSNDTAASALGMLSEWTFIRPTNYLNGLYEEVDKYLREPRNHSWW